MSKLREAAQAVVDHGPHRMTACSPLRWSSQSLEGDYLINLYNAIERLANALAEDRLAEPAEDGWRRCAEGQGETQHCGLLEAAVLAEREACAQMFDGEIGIYDYREIAAKIRARGKQE